MKHFAMITGASEGLGKSFAIESAKMGMDLFLVALPDTGLPGLCSLIKSNFGVYVDFLELDLCDDQDCLQLITRIKSKNYPISFLINNAGIGGNYRFSNEDFTTFNKMIQLNIKAFTMITHGLLDVLQSQEHAFILNVSSMIAHFEGPYKQVYGATKSFIHYFSNSLRQELKNTNVHISVLSPGGIHTNIYQFRICHHLDLFSRMTFLDPEFVASLSIQKCLQKKKEIIPGKLSQITFMFSSFLPQFFKEKMVRKTNTRVFEAHNSLKRI